METLKVKGGTGSLLSSGTWHKKESLAACINSYANNPRDC